MDGLSPFIQEGQRYVVIGLDDRTASAAWRQRKWWRRTHDGHGELELSRDEVPCRNPDCDRRMRWGDRAWGVYLRHRSSGKVFATLFHSERCHNEFLARFRRSR